MLNYGAPSWFYGVITEIAKQTDVRELRLGQCCDGLFTTVAVSCICGCGIRCVTALVRIIHLIRLPLRHGHYRNTGLNDRHTATSTDHAESTVTVNETPSATSPTDPTLIWIANRDAANLEVEETTGLCTASLQSQLGANDGASGCSVEIREEHPLVYHNHIPNPSATSPSNFRWGDRDGDSFTVLLDKVYEETVHWRPNIFEVPSGKIGSAIVRVVSRLIEVYNDATALESVAMKAVMVLLALLRQRPHRRSKARDHG